VERRDSRIAAAWAVAGLVLGALAASLAANPSETSTATLGVAGDVAAAREPPPVPFSFAHEHAFFSGNGRVAFDVEGGSQTAEVRVWYDLGHPTDCCIVRLRDPEGNVATETHLRGNSYAILGSTGVQHARITVAEGTYALEFVGRAAVTAHVEVASAEDITL